MTSRSARRPALAAPRPRSVAFSLLAAGLLLGAAAAVAEAKQPKVQVKVTGTTLVVSGTRNGEAIVLKLRSGDPTILQIVVDGLLEGTVDRSRFTTITADGGDGADTIAVDETNGIFTTTEATTLRGGAGNDLLLGGIGPLTLDGGAGDDVILGGDGADTIDGNQGGDTAFGGAGDDVFTWDPGDGSDTIEGGADSDTLAFHGANISEAIGLEANGGRLRLTRNIATITMDVDDVETVELRALGGADVVTVGDLSATAVTAVAVDLGASGGGGDGALDGVVVQGTAGDDTAALREGSGIAGITFNGVDVTATEPEAGDTTTFDGLAGDDHATYAGTAAADTIALLADGSAVRATTDGATLVGAIAEHLDVSALGGPDTIGATGNLAALTALTLDGGAGDDVIGGGNGPDLILGGDGADTIDGNQGGDTAFGGAAGDTFVWDPGDGSDTIEGGADSDTLAVHGANISEAIGLEANGGRLRLTRNIATITMDVDDVETVELRALGGADVMTVGDLSATAVTAVAVDLGASGGGGDGALDGVVVQGTAGDDSITVSGSGTSVAVAGLAATVSIASAEFANDSLDVETDAGTDTVDASGLEAGVIQLSVDGVAF